MLNHTTSKLALFAAAGLAGTLAAGTADASPGNGNAYAHGRTFDFDISNARVQPATDFAAKVSAVGAAIKDGSYHMPVTMRVEVGGGGYDVFGNKNDTSVANVNDDAGARHVIIDEVFNQGDDINITATSWLSSNSEYMTVSTDSDSDQVKVLRNGDAAPDIAGFDGQSSVVDFLEEYIDFSDNTIDIDDDQIIYLFELGTTNLSSSAADFQDLVVIITLGDSPADLETRDQADLAAYD